MPDGPPGAVRDAWDHGWAWLGWFMTKSMMTRMSRSWAAFMKPVNDPTTPWLRVRSARGAAAVQQACLDLLDGKVDARDGLMLAL